MPRRRTIKVLVLAGGPDRERPVSLNSGANVAGALRDAGHEVLERDILPDNLAALDEFNRWGGEVIFPAMHGAWGEGGGLQRILDERGVAYVGCRATAAELCMDKDATKRVLEQHGVPTPKYEVVTRGGRATLKAPLVIKPLLEGSSIDVTICKEQAKADSELARLGERYDKLLVEQYIAGAELSCGVIGGAATGCDEALPPIQIIPATEFYDYEAKYVRDDTRYEFDAFPAPVLKQIMDLAARSHRAAGCRHLSRVDFMLDAKSQPYVLEINTIPGFTSHSLVPKAAAKAGISFPQLVDRLVRLAVEG